MYRGRGGATGLCYRPRHDRGRCLCPPLRCASPCYEAYSAAAQTMDSAFADDMRAPQLQPQTTHPRWPWRCRHLCCARPLPAPRLSMGPPVSPPRTPASTECSTPSTSRRRCHRARASPPCTSAVCIAGRATTCCWRRTQQACASVREASDGAGGRTHRAARAATHTDIL